MKKFIKSLSNPFLIAILANGLIGTIAVASKIGFETVEPLLFIGLRSFFIGLIISLFIWNMSSFKNPAARKNFIINLILSILALGLWTIGLDQSTALKSALLSVTTPVFMYLLSLIMLHEELIKQALIGCLVALVGSLMMIGLPALISQSFEPGDIILLLSYFFLALMLVHSKQLYKWFKPIEVVGYRFGMLGIVLTTFITIHSGFSIFSSISLSGWMALVFAITVPGLIALPMFYWSLQQMEAERFAPILYFDPMIGSLTAALILDDRLTSGALIGVGIIIVGLLLSYPHHHRLFHRYHVVDNHSRLHRLTAWLGGLVGKSS